jgi:hypothetical protein
LGVFPYGQFPPFGIDLDVESPAHLRSQVALEQLTEQDPVHVMWQVALPLHVTLPLGPTVVVQVELLAQFRLHESVHAPEQVVWFSQDSEQLPASPPQVPALNAQLIPELQVQLAPVQTGGGAEEDPPQAQRTRMQMASRLRMQHFRPPSPIAEMISLTHSAPRILPIW